MTDHHDLLPELRRALQAMRSAAHMLRQPQADTNAAAFVCAAAEKALQEVIAALGAPPRKNRRVLVADADRAWADVLAETLRLEGHATGTATSSADVLAACSSFRPDVVIADMALTGQTAARNLRSVTPEAVLVALSTWTRESDLRLARDLGWDHYVNKPVSPVELARLVATLQPVKAVPAAEATIAEARRPGRRAKRARA